MKNFRILLIATALFFGATTLMTAQSKIAHINKQELVKAMPEYKTAQAEIEKMGKTYETTIQKSIKELENRISQLTPGELAEFRTWFEAFDAKNWDKEFEKDKRIIG